MGDALREAMEMPQGTDVERELKPLFAALVDRLQYARAKHDWPTTDKDDRAKFYALDALGGEFQELVASVASREGRAREKDEALDVIVVALRIFLGDYLPEGEK